MTEQERAETARLERALGHFRESVRGWSDRESERALAKMRAAPRAGWFRWPVLATVGLVLSAVPVYKTVNDRQQAAQALADAQLLEQVDREVSEAVPSPMEPLAQLVSWGPSQVGSQKGDVR
jgi:hypothetical protein